MTKGIFILDNYDLIYGSAGKKIREMIDIYAEPQTKISLRENLSLLSQAEVIFSGWGCPVMDEEFLAAAPNLKAVFYGAGSIKGFVSDAFWERDILVTSAYAANAIPVIEFTISQILFSLKRGWFYVNKIKKDKAYPSRQETVPGAFGSTVGIISLGMIGRGVCEKLRQFDVDVIAYDPYVKPEIADELGVELCSLEEIFQKSDVVSLHAPWINETVGLITGVHLASMKKNATFINTARGAIVREDEMIEVLQNRPDITALLDVTYPEPPVHGSPLYTLDNCILTPHIAGSLSNECNRMGEYMFEELERYLVGDELKWKITKKQSVLMA